MRLSVLKAGLPQEFMQADADNELVSLLKLKDAARRLLPTDSITRSVITAEPDTLPLAEAIPKFKVLDSLLVEELGAARRLR